MQKAERNSASITHHCGSTEAQRSEIKILRVDPEQSVYTGNNHMSDFQGPKELGMTTVRLRRGEFAGCELDASIIDHEITTHQVLLDIVE